MKEGLEKLVGQQGRLQIFRVVCPMVSECVLKERHPRGGWLGQERRRKGRDRE